MIYFLRTKKKDIFQQLCVEEFLLHHEKDSFCWIQEGSLSPAVVLGVSCKEEKWLNLPLIKEVKCPVIRRFSGGGCVVVDQHTIFASFIFSKKDLEISLYPEKILQWVFSFYQEVFQRSDFCLKGQDFVLGNKKCAGNAQYIKKGRFLHHTSFLWDYEDANMKLLKHPPVEPVYREGREHSSFLCRLSEFLEKEEFFKQFETTFKKHFDVQTIDISYIEKKCSGYSPKGVFLVKDSAI